MSAVDLLTPPDEKAVDLAIEAFSAGVRKEYGKRVAGIFLFGSRARGDHKPFSDVDVAVVLDDRGTQGLGHRIALSNLAYDVLLETGAEIQPWVFAKHEWDDPSLSADAGLIRSIKRDIRDIGARR